MTFCFCQLVLEIFSAFQVAFFRLSTQVLNNIAGQVDNPRNFDVDSIVSFLEALTADSAIDLSDLVPASVPSGLSIDS